MRGSFLKSVAACMLCAVTGALSMTALLYAVERSASARAGVADDRAGVANDRAGVADAAASGRSDSGPGPGTPILGAASGTPVSGAASADTVSAAPAFGGSEASRPPDIGATMREPGTPASEADAIVRLATTEPRAAMDRALAIERHWLRCDTAERVAAVWAERSPNAALAFVQATGEIDPEAKSRIRARVLDVWAVVDSAGALGYLLSPEGQNLFFFDRVTGRRLARELSTQKPYELLAAADALPRGVVRAELRDAAIPNLVAGDLAGAVREAALATPGSDQRQWVTSILPEFVRADPEGAVEWARDIDARVPGTLRSVSVLVQETQAGGTGRLNR